MPVVRALSRRLGLVAFVASLLTFWAEPLVAATTTYTGVWAGGTIAPGNTVVLNNGASVTGNVVANGTLQFNQTGLLTLSSTVSGTGTLTLTSTGTLNLTGTTATVLLLPSGTTAATNTIMMDMSVSVSKGLLLLCSGSGFLRVGNSGLGALGLSGGNVSTTWAYFGYNAASEGQCLITSGTLSAGSELAVGHYGTGSLNLVGGKVSSRVSCLGWSAGSTGSATVAGGSFQMGRAAIGGYGIGSLSVIGGSASGSEGLIGSGSGGFGDVVVSSGTLTILNGLTIGYAGTGMLVVRGGSVRTSGSAIVGYRSEAAGVASIDSGTWAHAGNLVVSSTGYDWTQGGLGGSGLLTVSGGLLTVSGTLITGQNGLVRVESGGTLQIGVLNANAVNNGTLILDKSGTAICWGSCSGSGDLVKRGSGLHYLAGASTLSGPTTIQQGTLKLAHSYALSASTITPLAGGTLSLTHSLQTTIGGLRPNAGGLVDVGIGMVTVASGLSVADLAAALQSGRGNGSWNGTSGITSSAVASSNGSRTVGWLDNGDGSVTFGYAAPGDTNLDGVVDVIDVAHVLVGQKFDTGQSATWSDGDFNFDGIVDILDVKDVLAADLYDAGPYNMPTGTIAAVPEPASRFILLSALSCGGYFAGRRKRHRWN